MNEEMVSALLAGTPRGGFPRRLQRRDGERVPSTTGAQAPPMPGAELRRRRGPAAHVLSHPTDLRILLVYVGAGLIALTVPTAGSSTRVSQTAAAMSMQWD
jgi:hypothetical protein